MRAPLRPARGLIVAGVALGVLAAPTAALAAPTISASGGAATFTDPDGGAGQLALTLARVDGPSVDPQGWNLAAFQLAPSVVPGAGCNPGLAGVVCPFGAASPSAITADLGKGDDEVVLDVNESAATTPASVILRGGVGNDRLAKIRVKATMEGGDGDDTLLPDELKPFSAIPGATPGDVIRGGAGSDTVAYETTPAPVVVSLDGVANDGRAGEKDLIAADVENIAGPSLGSKLTGGAGANRITGGEGKDTIVGGAGRDVLVGGAGNDELDATDGGRGDQVTCGDGDDLAFADYGDTVEASGCETVAWTPGLSSRSLRLRGRAIRVGLRCPGQARGCQGVLALRTAGRKPVTVARARYAIKRGKKTTLSLRPTSAGRRALRASKTVKATASIALDGGPTPVGVAVKIRR